MLSRGNILVVDDEINLCRILDAKLTKSGYEVMTVHDGIQAVEKIQEGQFDLVLLDLLLPKLDGLEALERIRKINSEVPVIIMTACENTEAVSRALSKGASAFVSKPFDLDRLVMLVKSTSSEGRSISTETTVMNGSGIFRKGHTVSLETAEEREGSIDGKLLERSDSTVSIALADPADTASLAEGAHADVQIASGDALYRFSSTVIGKPSEGVVVLQLPQVMYRVQRRKQPRVDVKAPVHYSDPSGARREAYTENIGAGGATIITASPLAPGDSVSLEAERILHAEKLKCEGRVVRCRKLDDTGRARYEVALQWERAEPELRRALLQHLTLQDAPEGGAQD